MKAFWLRTKASWLKSWPLRVRWGKWKWNAYFILERYFDVGQGFSGERCGPWASCMVCVFLVTRLLRLHHNLWSSDFSKSYMFPWGINVIQRHFFHWYVQGMFACVIWLWTALVAACRIRCGLVNRAIFPPQMLFVQRPWKGNQTNIIWQCFRGKGVKALHRST
jgi:hypothetical protein